MTISDIPAAVVEMVVAGDQRRADRADTQLVIVYPPRRDLAWHTGGHAGW